MQLLNFTAFYKLYSISENSNVGKIKTFYEEDYKSKHLQNASRMSMSQSIMMVCVFSGCIVLNPNLGHTPGASQTGSLLQIFIPSSKLCISKLANICVNVKATY